MKFQFVALLLLTVAISTTGSSAQQPLKINSPYQCVNNLVVVVKHCDQKADGEYCTMVKGPAGGPL